MRHTAVSVRPDVHGGTATGQISRRSALTQGTYTRAKSATDSTCPGVVPLLLRPREAAVMLGVSERALWGLIRTGALTPVRPTGMRVVRIARDDIETLVQRWRGTGTRAADEV